jgi:hypothetical protein
MQDHSVVNFYLDKHSIEIVDKLQSINRKFKQIISNVKNAEITLEEQKKEDIFEKIKSDVRTRK